MNIKRMESNQNPESWVGQGKANTRTASLGTSSIVNLDQYHPPILVSTELKENEVHLIYRQNSSIYQSPPRVYKEIWRARGGELVKTKTLEGTYVPPRVIKGSYEF